jgi:4-hydroxy-tetrahydrodipicolinate synthase
MNLFTGSGVAIITPFNEDLSINIEQYIELLDFHLGNSTDAIIVTGTTGEATTLNDDEKYFLFETTVKHVNGRIPVIAGTGTNDTAHAIRMSVRAEELGVNALLLVTPYYNKTTQPGLVAHFTAIADAVNIPVILYNVPSRTGVNIEPETVKILSQHPNIAGIKEASGNISQIVKTASLIPEDFYLYSGNDDQIVPILSVGGHGVISVLANIMPQETHDMVMHYLEGNVKKSMKLQLETKALNDAIFYEVNPIPIKMALNFMGMNDGPLRLPLIYLSEEGQILLRKEMTKMGLL